jgi:hypothetical protein
MTWTFRAFGQLSNAAAERAARMDSFQAQLVEVDRRFGEGDAAGLASRAALTVWAAWSRALDGMQPRLRQTPPSRLFLFDQNDFFAKVGGVESGGVSARAGAQHHNFSFDRDPFVFKVVSGLQAVAVESVIRCLSASRRLR